MALLLSLLLWHANLGDLHKPNRVALRDVQVITLSKGLLSTSRRTSPVTQLRCKGGSNNCRYKPDTVQCYNRGWDGQDVQWECRSHMLEGLRFGRTMDVMCEGYDYPEDPYILAGSCGLTYSIDIDTESSFPSNGYTQQFSRIFKIITFLGILWLLMKMWRSPFTSFRWNPFNRGPPYPPNSGWGFQSSSGTDSYSDGCRNNINGRFWSGLMLGALGGYTTSRYMNPGTPVRNYWSRRRSQSSSEFREVSGFASTSRR